MDNKKIIGLIIVIIVGLIIGNYFYQKKQDELKTINKVSNDILMVSEFEKIRGQVITNLSTDKDSLCDGNCFEKYQYDKNNFNLKVLPVEDYIQIEFIATDTGKYKDVTLSGDDCDRFTDIMCFDKTIKNNLSKDY